MFCNPCQKQIRKFIKKLDDTLLQNIDTAISVTEQIKRFINSDTVVLITEITPTDIDNQLREKINQYLPFVLSTLGILNYPNRENINQAIKYLQQLPEAHQKSLLFKIASLLLQRLDLRYKQNEYDTAIQLRYSLNKASV